MVLSINRIPFKLWLGIMFICYMCVVSQSAESQCEMTDDEFLVTFHPHLDAFWLNTDDELKNINFRPAGFLYAMNQRNSKQIFNSMYDALIQDEKRKYFVSEIVFFKDWYEYLDSSKKQGVKKMLKTGQLDISNSGWVQNDQAVCYYDDILQQYTVGMNWMYEQFGYINKIGWATDSFGHSHSQVALQHLLGFQFQGIERIDDRYIYQRKQKPLLQFYWQPVSDSNGRKYGGVVNHIRHFLHEVNDLRRTPSSSVSHDFNNLEKNMKTLYGKNKMFRFLGNDFEEFTKEQFKTLQDSFRQLNGNSKSQCIKYKYGNPKDYLQTIKPYWSKNKLQTRQSDFIPNWDQDRYWSGYYTTDPQLKIICKRFSRLVNLVRKVMVKSLGNDKNIFTNFSSIVQRAEELLAIMQHHDGITATSKSYIEKLFKDRMINSSKQLIEIVKKVDSLQVVQECKLYENQNTCNITRKQAKITLSIFHQGVAKKQRIQIILPDRWAYTVDGIETDIVASPLKHVSMIFEAEIKPGQNDFILKGEELSNFNDKIKTFQDKQTFDNGQGIKVSLQNNNTINYQFGENFMHFSFQTAANTQSRRQTVAWNKYGQRMDKTQSVIPGIYIMSNNGNLEIINPKWTVIKIVEFGNFYRVFFDGEKIDFELTFRKDDPSHVETNLIFTPNGYSMVDYFLRIQSNVKNVDNQFYHDSNGYLVAKRKIGYRPDYDWIYKPQDKINANTYPACSFIYQTNQQQKFIAFIDRALGVTTYDGSILINVDRLAGDDYKGVGEGYSFVRQNRFNFKFAITSKSDDLQRVWQRSYDDSLIGFFTMKQSVKHNDPNLRKTPQESENYLKYNVAFLNKNQILVRLHNLAQYKNLKISHFKPTSWHISEINLNISFTDIRESFANGLMFKQRYNWIGDDEEINHMTRGSEDSSDSIVLRPLEVRSWRINLSDKIVDREVGGTKALQVLSPEIKSKVQEQAAVVKETAHIKHALRKRCF